MGYADTAGVIIFCNPDHTFAIQIDHNACFYEYNSRLSIEYKQTPGYLLLQQDTEIILHNLDLLNLILCELDIKSTPFCDATIITYEIELPPDGKKIGINLLDCEYFTILYVIDTIPN